MSIGESTPKYVIKRLKLSNPNKILLGHLNINSVRSKFECLRDIINNNIDILLISETKLDVTFPVGQFLINGFHSPVRKDRNDKGVVLPFTYRNISHLGKLWFILHPISR